MDAAKGVLFHDPRGLQALKREAVQDPAAAIRPVARQFESVFLQMMLKCMRAAVPDGGLFTDEGGKAYRDMFDNQLAVNLAEQGGVGMADMMVRQLTPAVAAAASASGTTPAAAITPAATAPSRPEGQALQLHLHRSDKRDAT